MTARTGARRVRVPWLQRLFEALPLAPGWIGLALGGVLIALFLASELALGRFDLLLAEPHPAGLRHDFRIAMVLLAMLAYLPTARAYLVRGARRTLDELRPVLQAGEAEFARRRMLVGRYDPRVMRGLGAFGLAAGVATQFLANLSWSAYDTTVIVPEPTWHRVTAPLLGWAMLALVNAMVTESRRLSRVARELLQVDLLDREPLASFARQGLRNALLAMGLLALAALLLLDVDVAPGFEAVALGLLGLALVLAGAGLVLPVRGVHGRIREEKRLELARCAGEIRRTRADPVAVPGRLADLVAYRGVVESVPEWPFDASTLARFALYVALPVGSWVGGAMVERLVSSALG